MGDQIVRALTKDCGFFVMAVRTTETVRGIIEAQGVEGITARRLGELITSAIVVREAIAPHQRIQAILQGTGGHGTLVADARPGGLARGLVAGLAPHEAITTGGGSLLQVVRTLSAGQIQQGIIDVSSDRGIAGAFMEYMQRSEQATAFLAASCQFSGNTLEVAGGYIVQVMPEFERGALALMTARIEGFQELEPPLEIAARDADEILSEVLYGLPHTRIDERPLQFACTCDAVTVVSALATLGRDDIQELVSADEPIEMTCDYCRRTYNVAPAQLRGLLQGS